MEYVLESAVRHLSDRLADESQRDQMLCERGLWTHLLECMFSSQVRYEVAHHSAHRVADLLFSTANWSEDDLSESVAEVLLSPLSLECGEVRYRFPKSRAHYVARTYARLSENGACLSDYVYSKKPDYERRADIVELALGIGFKQASMMLRDIGIANRLAILDRHILRYMEIVGLIDEVPTALSPRKYCELEESLSVYADHIGQPLAILDRSIWLVMRAATKEQMI